MKCLIKNLFYFLLLNLAIFAVILFAIHIFFINKHWNTDSDVFTIPQNKSYSLLFMGTSHGEIFTRFNNQHFVECILHQNFFNVSQPDAGPVMEKLYLQFFLERNNKANTIVYFVDPHVFYSDKENENYHLLPYGELDPNFLRDTLENHIGYESNLDYIKTYISLKWIIKKPVQTLTDLRVWNVSKIDETNRLKQLYPDGTNEKTFNKYSKVLDEIIEMAKKNNIKVVFIIPTTLIRNQPGMERLKRLLKQYKKEKYINYYDFSHAVKDHYLYSDVDHLNTKGVVYFTKKYLNEIPELKNNK